MSKEKKTTEIKEEIKEEIKNSAQLTDEQMAEVTGGMAADPNALTAELAAQPAAAK